MLPDADLYRLAQIRALRLRSIRKLLIHLYHNIPLSDSDTTSKVEVENVIGYVAVLEHEERDGVQGSPGSSYFSQDDSWKDWRG